MEEKLYLHTFNVKDGFQVLEVSDAIKEEDTVFGRDASQGYGYGCYSREEVIPFSLMEKVLPIIQYNIADLTEEIDMLQQNLQKFQVFEQQCKDTFLQKTSEREMER